MILFRVDFKNNIAVSASITTAHKQIEVRENPFSIVAIEVYANNNLQALELAQEKANALLKIHT